MKTVGQCGGAAFPAKWSEGLDMPALGEGQFQMIEAEGCGMTLRDYFAAKAMQGLLSASDTAADNASGPRARAMPTLAAQWAYEQAAAMLAERVK